MKNPGGRPGRRIDVSEMLVLDLMIASSDLERAVINLHNARKAFIADANAGIARVAARKRAA